MAVDEPEAERDITAWIEGLRALHASAQEFDELIASDGGGTSVRAEVHLRECTICRECLSAYIENKAIAATLESAGLDRELVNYTGHAEPVVRAAAARAVVTFASEAPLAVEALKRLHDDPDELVRADALLALGRSVQIAGAVGSSGVPLSNSSSSVSQAEQDPSAFSGALLSSRWGRRLATLSRSSSALGAVFSAMLRGADVALQVTVAKATNVVQNAIEPVAPLLHPNAGLILEPGGVRGLQEGPIDFVTNDLSNGARADVDPNTRSVSISFYLAAPPYVALVFEDEALEPQVWHRSSPDAFSECATFRDVPEGTHLILIPKT